ncbi:uncharacterized protein LOC126203557 isoform X3 [Schistocerca nitens]|uniref:uncharacterized protein LOC126203557 isoform X3 n=1 Tax=Schistocerca nitens TaxID=7011 RepID=UPI0021173AC9|nr:uncharacterized protein LOC126203557 isoform X3 [Schistocerca nitens]
MGEFETGEMEVCDADGAPNMVPQHVAGEYHCLVCPRHFRSVPHHFKTAGNSVPLLMPEENTVVHAKLPECHQEYKLQQQKQQNAIQESNHIDSEQLHKRFSTAFQKAYASGKRPAAIIPPLNRRWKTEVVHDRRGLSTDHTTLPQNPSDGENCANSLCSDTDSASVVQDNEYDDGGEEEIVNEEIVNEEIVNEEIVNEEIVNEEIVNEEIHEEEIDYEEQEIDEEEEITNEEMEEGFMNEETEEGFMNEETEEGFMNEETEEGFMNEETEEGFMNEETEEGFMNEETEEGFMNEETEEGFMNEETEESIMNKEIERGGGGLRNEEIEEEDLINEETEGGGIVNEEIEGGGIVDEETEDGIMNREVVEGGIIDEEEIDFEEEEIDNEEEEIVDKEIMKEEVEGGLMIEKTEEQEEGLMNEETEDEGITNGEVVAGGITNGEVVAGGITNGEVVAGGIRNREVAAGGIRNGEVTAGGIRNGEVIAGGIRNGTVTGEGINNGAVLGGVIRNGVVVREGITNGTVVGEAITNGTVGGGGIMNGVVVGGGMRNLVVIRGGIRNLVVGGGGVTIEVVRGGGITNGGVVGRGIRNGDVVGGGIANGGVTGGGIANGGVTGGGIANGVVTGVGIASGGVAGGGIAKGGVAGGGIAKGGVAGAGIGTANGGVAEGGTANGGVAGGGTANGGVAGGRITNEVVGGGMKEGPGSSNSDLQSVKQAELKPPPIILHIKGHYRYFLQLLKEWTTEDFSVRTAGKDLIRVNFCNIADYKRVESEAAARQILFYTHTTHADKVITAVFRGLPRTFQPHHLWKELEELGFAVHFVVRMKYPKTGREMPLFLVVVPETPQNRKIFSITLIANRIISVENLKRRRGGPRCFRCQAIGHMAHHCSQLDICIQCTGEHQSQKCLLLRNKALKFMNCGARQHEVPCSQPKQEKANHSVCHLDPTALPHVDLISDVSKAKLLSASDTSFMGPTANRLGQTHAKKRMSELQLDSAPKQKLRCCPHAAGEAEQEGLVSTSMGQNSSRNGTSYVKGEDSVNAEATNCTDIMPSNSFTTAEQLADIPRQFALLEETIRNLPQRIYAAVKMAVETGMLPASQQPAD